MMNADMDGMLFFFFYVPFVFFLFMYGFVDAFALFSNGKNNI